MFIFLTHFVQILKIFKHKNPQTMNLKLFDDSQNIKLKIMNIFTKFLFQCKINNSVIPNRYSIYV